MEELILGKNDCIRIQGANVRVKGTKSLITRPVNKLFQVETTHDSVDVNNVINRDNDIDETEIDKEQNEMLD